MPKRIIGLLLAAAVVGSAFCLGALPAGGNGSRGQSWRAVRAAGVHCVIENPGLSLRMPVCEQLDYNIVLLGLFAFMSSMFLVRFITPPSKTHVLVLPMSGSSPPVVLSPRTHIL